jgi:hypothetical protein
MPDCIVLFRYRIGSGIVSLSQSDTGLDAGQSGTSVVSIAIVSIAVVSIAVVSIVVVGIAVISNAVVSTAVVSIVVGSIAAVSIAEPHHVMRLQSPVVMRLQSGMSCDSSLACHAAPVRHSDGQQCSDQHCSSQHCGTGSQHWGSQYCGAASCHAAPVQGMVETKISQKFFVFAKILHLECGSRFRNQSNVLYKHHFDQCCGAGAASFGRSRNHNAVRLRLRQWYLSGLGI